MVQVVDRMYYWALTDKFCSSLEQPIILEVSMSVFAP